MKNRKWILRGILIAVIGLVLLGAVLVVWLREAKGNPTLEKIAYDHSKKNPVVYIKENGEYVPYLVLTSDYDGNVLLLRENVLPEEMQYKPSEYGRGGGALSEWWTSVEYGSYYEESSIDKFLNAEFMEVFGRNVRASIVDTTIEVTDMDSYDEENWAEATHMIERKVFLLSAVELDVDFGVGYTMTKEGEPLRYFRNKEHSVKKAYKSDGEAWPYWTRTPHIWETYEVAAIGVDYEVITATADRHLGVRPAFCMKKDTVVRKSDRVIEGKSVYILELDDG